MIRYGGSLEVAGNVLQHLMDDARSASIDGYVGSYQNGREQGYSISAFPTKTAYFAQYRSTDDIVVYFGEHSMQSITDLLYCNRRFFKYDDVPGAVDYIYECLKAE